jgi:hypothetical protein
VAARCSRFHTRKTFLRNLPAIVQKEQQVPPLAVADAPAPIGMTKVRSGVRYLRIENLLRMQDQRLHRRSGARLGAEMSGRVLLFFR